MYRRFTEVATHRFVRGGECVRFYMRELEAYMATSIHRALAQESMRAVSDKVMSPQSCFGQFILEKADHCDGSTCRWNEVFRLRHISSSMFLTVGTAADHPETAGQRAGAPSVGNRRASFFSTAQAALLELSNSKVQYKDRLRCLLTPDRNSPHTLFTLVPQYAGAVAESSDVSAPATTLADDAISAGQSFAVRHVATRQWLHCDTSSSAKVFPTVSTSAQQEEVQKQQAKSRWGGIKTMVASGIGMIDAAGDSDMLEHAVAHICATKERHEEDMFIIRRVPKMDYEDTLYIRSRVKSFRAKLSMLKDGLDPVTQWPLLQGAAMVLTELIVFVTDSDNPDPFTREGIPIVSRQLLLTELQFFDLAVDGSVVLEKIATQVSRSSVSEDDDEYDLMDKTEGSFKSNSRKTQRAMSIHPARTHTVRDGPRPPGMLKRQTTTGLLKIGSQEDEAKKANKDGRSPLAQQCLKLGILCQRLARHCIRGHEQNKKYGMRFAPQLQNLLGKGVAAAETLREVFKDNAEVLDMVTDDMIKMFVEFIRTGGRESRYVEFLRVLCVDSDKAVRKNQWRICQFFVLDAPELHVKFSMQNEGQPDQRVVVSADSRYFPAFVGSQEIEIGEWLATASQETVAYVEQCISLYDVLVQGRNVKNTAHVQERLPYSVVHALVTDQKLHDKHLSAVAQFVSLARVLYVDAEPHQTMCKIRSIRIWDNVRLASLSGKLSSRLITTLRVDWARFDDLKSFIANSLAKYATIQRATRIQENRMTLELLKLLYHLLMAGFYESDEVGKILPVLLEALDGRQDRVGGAHDDSDRYMKIKTIRMDTVSIMECKLWVCRILQLVVTMRLDIRLSIFLSMYRDSWDSGKYAVMQNGLARAERRPDAGEGSVFTTVASKVVEKVSDGIAQARRHSMGYLRLTDHDKERARIFDVLCLDADSNVDFVHALLDLTFYHHSELVTAAMGLLVRHFDQRSVLLRAARETRLLVNPAMIDTLKKFDDALRKLRLLGYRRRLFGTEPYEAVRLVSIIVMHCYEESADANAGKTSQNAPSSSSHHRSVRSAMGRSSTTGGTRALKTPLLDHAPATHQLESNRRSVYLVLVGKAHVSQSADWFTLSHLEPEERMLRRGDQVDICGFLYSVRHVDSSSKKVTVDREIKIKSYGSQETGVRDAPSKEASNAGGVLGKDVWIFVQNTASQTNSDAQSLLYQMGAHEIVLKLLQLPFQESRVFAEDVETRAVACACYRLLRAMTARFPSMQKALVRHMAVFLRHTEVHLVATDITPTDCISAIYKDNRVVCTQVGEDMIRHFVRLAANEHAPRFLRFLGMIAIPSGRPVRRCQSLVLQYILEKEEALWLYDGDGGHEKREKLIAADDLEMNPRGRLAYHVELITLFAQCVEGSPPVPVMQLQTIMPLDILVGHLLQASLPLQLKRSYLAILDCIYLEGDRTDLLRRDDVRDDVLMLMDTQLSAIDRFIEHIVPIASFEDEDEVSEANFIFFSVLSTVRLFYENVYSRGAFGSSMDTFTKSLAHALILLGQCSDSNPNVLSPMAVAECLDAIHAADAGVVGRETRRTGTDEPDDLGHQRLGRALNKADATVVQRTVLAIGGDSHPQERLREFIDEFEASLKVDGALERETTGLVDVFVNFNERDDKQAAGKLRTSSAKGHHRNARRSSILNVAESNKMLYTKNLISQLSASHIFGKGGPTEQEVSQTVASLQVLQTMVNRCEDGSARKRQQLLLTHLGATKVFLAMASCENDELCHQGLELGIALLFGGNRDVQRSIHETLTQSEAEATLRPFDGTSQTFLGMMRMRLRLAAKEVPERKTFNEVQSEMRENMIEEFSTASSATIAQMQIEIDKEFPARSHALSVLEVLRLLCEGHNNALQDLLHVQDTTSLVVGNVDLVGEVFELLAVLEPEVDSANISQMQLCLDTLVEFAQGNQTGKIASFLLDTKLLEILDRLIQKPSMPGVELQGLLGLQLSTTLLLLALLEHQAVRAEARLLSVLDLRRLAEVAAEFHERSQDEDLNDQSKAAMLDVGSQVYLLVHHLLDVAEQGSYAPGSSKLRRVGGAVLERILALFDEEKRETLALQLSYYQKYTTRVELINQAGSIQYAYFRFPDCCLLLTAEAKDDVLYSVDRSTQGRQIQEFFNLAKDLHIKMRHQEELNQQWLWRLLYPLRAIAPKAILLIALLQNFLILLDSAMADAPQTLGPVYDLTTFSIAKTNYLIATLCGVGQAMACIVVFLIHAMQDGQLRVRQRRGKTIEPPNSSFGRSCSTMMLHAMAPYYLLTDTKLLFYIFGFIFSLLGLGYSSLFFSFHLLDIVNHSTDLQSVFKAVTLNGRSILATAVFGFIVIYLYAIVGFAYGQDLFMAGDYPDGSPTNEFAMHPDESMCRNLAVCWVSAVVNGLREGDIGKIMEPRYSTDDRYGFIVVYQFTYYLIVITVLLNVIFGIIIDTFGQLRTEAEGREFKMQNACFICGIDRFTFDTKGEGFKRHIHADHNMWHYLYMIVHIREKDPTEYNGWEQYVADKVQQGDTSFFPLNNAIVLKDHKERQERDSLQLMESVRGMATTLSQLGQHIERVEATFVDRVSALASSQRSLEQALNTFFLSGRGTQGGSPGVESSRRSMADGTVR